MYKECVRKNKLPSHRSAHLISSVVSLTIVVYAALVVFAAGCASMPVGASEGHDHHSQDTSHSLLCAWSCQIVSQSGPTASVPPVVANFVATPVLLTHVPTHTDVLFTSRSSRAPPSLTLG